MSAVKCDHGMPSPTSCVDCMNDDGVGGDTEPITVEALTTAKHQSKCGCLCGTDIYIGERIVLLSSGPWVDTECARRICGASA